MATKKETKKYYNLKKLLSFNADYNLIIGERSNGKTYATLNYCLERYVNHGEKFVYIRRWKEDIVGKRGDVVFNGICQNGVIRRLTSQEYRGVSLSCGKYYFSTYDTTLKKTILADDYFCHLLSLSDMEHDKSLSFHGVKNIIFDEFLTRRFYLKDEFILFMNVLSTIIRDRKDVKIFMLGNTVNKYSPYFEELGIKVEGLVQGEIALFHYGDSELTLAIEYCNEGNESEKASNKYFAFNNPRLNMIKSGQWELDIYPHLPPNYSIKESDILFTFFIIFQEKIVQGNVIRDDYNLFLFFHYKTTPIKEPENHLIYSLKNNINMNYRRNPLRGLGGLENKINMLFAMNKIFYASNEVGECVRNYLEQAVK